MRLSMRLSVSVYFKDNVRRQDDRGSSNPEHNGVYRLVKNIGWASQKYWGGAEDG